jgi:hypothetical protein
MPGELAPSPAVAFRSNGSKLSWVSSRRVNPEHPTVRGVARLLPGIVAASLALVYVVGSVNAAGALARDGISVSAVRLLSLEQILVRGVSVLTQPELLIGGIALAAILEYTSSLGGRVIHRVRTAGSAK